MRRFVQYSSLATTVFPLAALLSCAASAPTTLPATAPSAPASSVGRPLRPTGAPRPADALATPVVLASVQLAAVGDILPHGMLKEAARLADVRGAGGESVNFGGYGVLLAPVRDELRGADLAFANLETPVAPKADRGSRPFVFNAPPELLGALQDAGMDVVSFANNHVYDQGRAGFLETVELLESVKLPQVGAGRTCAEASRARLFELKGIKLALIGATKLYNDELNAGPGEPCSFKLDEAVALKEAAAARAAGAELVLLSIHWGVEYVTAPRQEEIDLAHRLLEGGFDAILGHHPHVLQPVEVYETKDGRLTFVAYSLGNFISNQSRTYAFGVQPDKMGNSRDGVILRFHAVRKDYGQGTIRTELADLSVQPLWTENNALEKQRDPRVPIRIRVVANDRAAAEVRTALAGTADQAEAVKLQRRLELYEKRRKLAAAILGEDLLR